MAIMKKMYFFLVLLLGSISVCAQSPNLSKNDYKEILQLCINIPQLEEYIPKDNEGNIKQLYVYYYAPQFIPEDINLTKGGKILPFREIIVNESEINDCYFLFEKWEIEAGKGTISFSFTKNSAEVRKHVKITTSLQKVNNNWIININTINVQ